MTTDKNVTTFGTGKGHVCAIDVTGDLFCWGLNDQGQLGIGKTWATEPVKTTVP